MPHALPNLHTPSVQDWGAGTNPHDDIKLPGEYVPSSYLWFLGNPVVSGAFGGTYPVLTPDPQKTVLGTRC